MIFSLDFGAKNDVLDWANEVVAAHPDHRVIVSTHGYLEPDGTTLDHGEEYAPSASYYDPASNDGNAIWKRFVSKHENIFLVLSGHMSSNTVVFNQREGENGNTVTEMLVNPQTVDKEYEGGTGMVAMLYFCGEEVFVEYYSTSYDMYRPLQSFGINHKHVYEPIVIEPTCDAYGYTRNECSCGKSYRTGLIPSLEHVYDSDADADCNLCGKVRRVESTEPSTEDESRSEPETEEILTEESAFESESGAVDSDNKAEDTDTPLLIVIAAAVAVGLLAIGALVLLIKRKKNKEN
jgi:hypothetical protein